ncbi:MAG: RidA family protein [Candidatus Lokiarchaeota archaeon]|nr:RidA family protein [Candidatus Lokiarchaeota archaeon]
MKKEVIIPKDGAPAAGPYSAAIKVGNFMFISGQGPFNPETNRIDDPENVKSQTKICMENIGRLLDAAGIGYENIVKTTVFLKNIKDFNKMNRVYRKFFKSEPPARSCVEVAKLPFDILVEIEAIAFIP